MDIGEEGFISIAKNRNRGAPKWELNNLFEEKARGNGQRRVRRGERCDCQTRATRSCHEGCSNKQARHEC
eukprot:1410561-Rhodomonas_salina.1